MKVQTCKTGPIFKIMPFFAKKGTILRNDTTLKQLHFLRLSLLIFELVYFLQEKWRQIHFQRLHLFCSKRRCLEKWTCLMMTPFFKMTPFGFNLGIRALKSYAPGTLRLTCILTRVLIVTFLSRSFSCLPEN